MESLWRQRRIQQYTHILLERERERERGRERKRAAADMSVCGRTRKWNLSIWAEEEEEGSGIRLSEEEGVEEAPLFRCQTVDRTLPPTCCEVYSFFPSPLSQLS